MCRTQLLHTCVACILRTVTWTIANSKQPIITRHGTRHSTFAREATIGSCYGIKPPCLRICMYRLSTGAPVPSASRTPDARCDRVKDGQELNWEVRHRQSPLCTLQPRKQALKKLRPVACIGH
ncbi:hypothetical protein F4859DRAFT_126593 [Xylaria cf. heliscus]|nr:hypothetical protein F4859DRAFT_126593 [Xylaria cf. heliscus]